MLINSTPRAAIETTTSLCAAIFAAPPVASATLPPSGVITSTHQWTSLSKDQLAFARPFPPRPRSRATLGAEAGRARGREKPLNQYIAHPIDKVGKIVVQMNEDHL
jgi:hypothetical protein